MKRPLKTWTDERPLVPRIRPAGHGMMAMGAALVAPRTRPLIGVAISSIVPALFWCVVIWRVGTSFGMAPGIQFLLAIGLAITAFLAFVTGAVLVKA